jgi:hypothetical protein
MIKPAAGDGQRVSIRQVLRGSNTPVGRFRPRRRTKVLVGWLAYCLTAVGGTAAAWTVREALFPSGGPSTKSVWVNPGHDTIPPAKDDSDDAVAPSPTVAPAAADVTVAPLAGAVIDAATAVSSSSLPGRDGASPTVPVGPSGLPAANPGAGTGSGGAGASPAAGTPAPRPVTATTADAGNNSGPGGPGPTTAPVVATTTPSPKATQPTTPTIPDPPTSQEPNVSPAPTSADTVPDQSGKGKGGGGKGGGGTTTPTTTP